MKYDDRSAGLNSGAPSSSRRRGSRLLIGLVAVGLVVGASAATAAADDWSHSLGSDTDRNDPLGERFPRAPRC